MEKDIGYSTSSARLEVNEIDGELVILNLDNGYYFTIEGVGADIWALVERGATRESIVQAISEQYGIGSELVRPEVMDFLEKLTDEGLLETSETTTEASNDASSDYGGWRPAFVPTTLSKYDDLTESFALDPPLVIGGQ